MLPQPVEICVRCSDRGDYGKHQPWMGHDIFLAPQHDYSQIIIGSGAETEQTDGTSYRHRNAEHLHDQRQKDWQTVRQYVPEHQPGTVRSKEPRRIHKRFAVEATELAGDNRADRWQ